VLPVVALLALPLACANVVTDASFRRMIDCMLRQIVVPRMARNRPDVVVFTEDIGLMTIATGSRGKATRDAFASGAVAPGASGFL